MDHSRVLHWLHELAAALDATGLPTLVGFVASLVALIGVPGAFWKAAQARKSADAASQAARDALERLSVFESVASLSAAIEQIEGMKELHRRKAWTLAVARYSPIRRALNAVRQREERLSDEHLRDLQAVVSLLGRMEQELDSALTRGKVEPNPSRLNRQLSGSLDRLQALLHHLQRSTSERRDDRH